MQREIKYRAWNKVWKCMYYLTGFRLVGKKHIQLYYLDADGSSTTCTALLENIILMQYTGLKDKNGKEIYEGDIVKHDFEFGNGKGIVYYSTPKFSLKEIGIKAVCDCFTWDEWERFEIIGNIHENPELLEVSE